MRFITEQNRQGVERRLLLNSVVRESGCREWQGKPNSYGYGRMWVDGVRPIYVHQLAFELWNEPITEETIDHLCANRLCIEPSHLDQCSKSENTLRGLARNKKTHCPHGHPYSPENYDAARYRCRACHAERERLRRLDKKLVSAGTGVGRTTP